MSSFISRRRFVKIAGITTVGVSFAGFTHFTAEGVSIVSNPNGRVVGASPVQWALNELEKSLTLRGIIVRRLENLTQADSGDLIVLVEDPGTNLARQLLSEADVSLPDVSEALALVPVKEQLLLACGSDERGLVYALLELADRITYVQNGDHSLTSLELQTAVIERPTNKVRSNQRQFVSDVEDKPWYNDREMWPEYLTMLATNRFNRFNLSFGMGFDFLRNVEDAYFLFLYPFLVSLPEYNVRVPQLTDAERDRNLEMLKYISEQTVMRGMEFQLGIWTHGYEWINSPNANYTIEGLTPEIHSAYCRDALRTILQACPAISGVTIRIHGESGIYEGSYDFWETVFSGVATCGRKVRIDMHAKGLDQIMLDIALATGMPTTISPKYWAEHIGMPYHQADIRSHEYPELQRRELGEQMGLSEGTRSFTRYGYGDFLPEIRDWTVLHRIWPGTQRLLLWGDPLSAAAHSRAFTFCDSQGVELMEPLSLKGRRGTGNHGNRTAYSDLTLVPRWDWQKYLYTFRVFGRLLFNPDTEPEVWLRFLKKEFGAGAKAVELALANATRILPIVTTAHTCSAANQAYWPEIHTNQSISDLNTINPFFDSPRPRVFGNVEPLDPQLFLRINDFAKELLLLTGGRSGKYTPIEVAQWVEDYAEKAIKHLAHAKAQVDSKEKPEFRRIEIDVSIQIGLGQFFASKFRSGVLYAIFEQSQNRTALEEALKMYRQSRNYWAKLAYLAEDVYQPDITFGPGPQQRGHWLDQLPAIDEDIAHMENRLKETNRSNFKDSIVQQERINFAIQEALGRPQRSIISCDHSPPEKFRVGNPIDVTLAFEDRPRSAFLYYRHVNHGERWQMVRMWLRGDKHYYATIPAAYTNSLYPIQYYFELKDGPDSAWLFPGFDANLINQPYFVVRQI